MKLHILKTQIGTSVQRLEKVMADQTPKKPISKPPFLAKIENGVKHY